MMGLRILVSDYSGHPFQVQLSRELARRGHVVAHTFSAGFQTPRGNLVVGDDDPAGFSIVPVSNSRPFAKDAFFRRRQQEIEIGEELAKLVRSFEPEVIISSNAPLDTQRIFQRAALRQRAKFVFWLQDIYSQGIARVVRKRFPLVGHAIAAWYRHLEFRMLRASDHVVAITQDFVPIVAAEGVEPDKISVVENWAPLDELPHHPRDNAWTQVHMPDDGLRIVYSGTLGYKHNPGLLLALARELPDAHIYVFSEGQVANKLAADAAAAGLANLSVRAWVPFAELPMMLAGADIFVAVIEPEAGVYSVPSKVLTYLAVGRPILASVPPENLAARLIRDHDAGYTSPPGAEAMLVGQARMLSGNAELRASMGENGRAYARSAFDIEAIGDRFSEIVSSLVVG
jgi:colanic acid biosynthesis glycosyl transferase WcaI